MTVDSTDPLLVAIAEIRRAQARRQAITQAGESGSQPWQAAPRPIVGAISPGESLIPGASASARPGQGMTTSRH